MPNPYKTHLPARGCGRPRKDGRVKTLCGYFMDPKWLGDVSCVRCKEYKATHARGVDPWVLEAYKVQKRLYNRLWRRKNRERSRASWKASYQKNRLRIAEVRRETYRITKEQSAERHRRWNAANRAWVSAYNRAYRAKKRELRLLPDQG